MVTIRRFVTLSSESLVGDNEVVIESQQTHFATMALEMTLLLEGMVTSIKLRASTGPSIILTLIEGDKVAKTEVSTDADGTLIFTIGRNQAEYLQAVFLRAYRDGMAEVNHVHIEGNRNGDPFDLTVMFDSYGEPMTSEEADKLLHD